MTLDTGLRLTLRPYQAEAIERTEAAEARGVRRQLGVAATGLGKTIVFCALAQQRGRRTLVLVHRDELVRQAVAKMREVWPGVDVGVVKAKENEVHADVVVASVQTLSRATRLAQLTGAFDLVIVDEAHHTAADTYRRILDAVGAGTDNGPLLLGVTATPDRGDGKGLDDLFDEITWVYDILWGIRSGYLCDVRGLRVTVDALDLSGVRMNRGDYDAGQAGQAMTDADAPAVIVRAWQQHASDRQTLVFTPTVALAEEVALAFKHAGVRAECVSGGTPLDDRRAILASYAAERTQVLVNCAVLTEGYDNPRTDCVVVARPTKSRALFTQMIGRGTRKHPAKADLLVLDVVGATGLHSLVTVPSLFGVDPDEWPEMHNGTGILTDVMERHEHQLVLQGKLRAEEADLFAKVRAEGIAWVPVHDPGDLPRYHRGTVTINDLGERVYGPTVVLTQREATDDGWLAGYQHQDGSKTVLIRGVTMELAQGVAEDAVRRIMGAPELARLVDADAAWRRRKPTPRQLEAARKWRMPNPSQYATSGELSDALDAHIARKRAS